ncbi:MAG: hypothetical protein R3Y12_05425 [Clostridia bacterium]
MLNILVPSCELWDEKSQEFIEKKEQYLQLEHSLVSLSKWEAKWCKPFLGNTEKTSVEILDYIRCMTITQNIPIDVYDRLTKKNVADINDYIEAKMTATFFNNEKNKSRNSEIITSELIYYWMICHNIPFECQKWHLKRLLTLIQVCNIKNQPPKKRSKNDIMSRNATLNASRRKMLNSTG